MKMINKTDYEEALSAITKKILNYDELLKIKPKELVNNNFSKDFLMELPKNGNVVLSMGMNPGGGNEIVNFENKTKDSIFFLSNDLNKDEKDNLKIFNDVYIFTKNYYKANYEIFEEINAKAHWAMDGYLSDGEIKKMILNSKTRNQNVKYDKNRIIQIIRKMQEIERNKSKENYKKDVYVLFSDLLWYADGNQKNIEKCINEKNFYNYIKEIIKLNIAYYKPKLIVITNAKVSHWVKSALRTEFDSVDSKLTDVVFYDGIPIILASMVSGRRPMDEFSKFRLKERIKEYYKE